MLSSAATYEAAPLAILLLPLLLPRGKNPVPQKQLSQSCPSRPPNALYPCGNQRTRSRRGCTCALPETREKTALLGVVELAAWLGRLQMRRRGQNQRPRQTRFNISRKP